MPRFSLLLSLLLACLASAQTTPPVATKTVEIPLLDCAGLPCVDMTMGSGKAIRLLIDLAEANSYLDSKVAQSLGAELQSLKGSDASTASEVQQTVMPGAKLGDLPLGDFPFLVLDTTPQPDKVGQTIQRLPGDGALTFNAFKNRLLQLDYARHVARISEPQASPQPCLHACTDLIVKHIGRFGPVTLTTPGFNVNGQQVDAQIDTLFTGTMLVYPASVEKLGLQREAKAKHKASFPFTQGGVKLVRAENTVEGYGSMHLLESGPLYFFTSDETPAAAQFDVTVGSGLLSHAVFSFDFAGMHLWVEAAAEPAPANR